LLPSGKHDEETLQRRVPYPRRHGGIVKVTYENCAGADVHKDSVVVCVLRGPAGGEVRKEVRTFGTTTEHLLKLSDWLAECEVTHVAMESTGVYWQPIFNVLEGTVEVWLVNAHHVKTVPGRKTDVRDCEWLADLLRHGLVRASFIPPEETRNLRELTRYRRTLVRERSHEVNRIQKVLEQANLKLSSVATNVLGVSGRAMLKALIAGETDGVKLAELAVGKLKAKKEELTQALTGRLKEHQRLILKELVDHVEYLEAAIDRLSARIEQQLRPFEEAIQRLDKIAGVDRRTIEDVLAEIGTDMKRFPTSAHLASWAGLCPGNNESAGKRLSGRTRKGSTWLRTALVQAAWAASRKKKSYFNAQFYRLKARRGAKKAVVAVAHSLLVVIYEMLSKGTTYIDLGPDHFDRINRKATANRLASRLRELGYEVHLKLKEPA
jgi:transposase